MVQNTFHRICRVLLCGVLPLACGGHSFAADRVAGANATLDIEPGARSAALGSATMAVDGDYLGLVSNPYQLSSIRYGWANFSHTAYFEDTQYDFASAAVPLGEGQGLGISFARFGADDIPYIREGEPIPEGSDYNTLSYLAHSYRMNNRVNEAVEVFEDIIERFPDSTRATTAQDYINMLTH
jgi:hypothetical protein